MNYFRKTNRLVIAIGLSLVAGIAGCIAEPGAPDTEVDGMVSAGDLTPEAWTGWTSDEYPPLNCPTATLVHGVECYGDYCDDVRLDCDPVSGMTFGSSSWSTWFSEEGTNWRKCDPNGNEWMTGIHCDGDNCDNVSIECTHITSNGRPVVGVSCLWSGWYSEEDGPYYAYPGRYVRGVECRGSDCDDMRYWVCTPSVQ